MKSFFIVMVMALALVRLQAEEVDEVVIIVKTKPEEKQQPLLAVVDHPNRERGDYIRSVWTHPDQTFVDSDLGPLPLYTEVVYDGEGKPVPRIPDALTKMFMDDPNEQTALLYLEGQKVRVRRYNEASSVMQRTAVQHGFVTPDVFSAPPGKMPQDAAFTPPYDRSRSEWGVPALDPQQARLAGMKPSEIPETPGRTTTRYVEAIYIWDHRCVFSMKGMRDFAEFGEELFNRQLGPRALTVSMDNDEQELFKQKAFLEYLGVPMQRIENFSDITDLRNTLHITRTPTYFFLDRRTGKMLRLEGLQARDAIRSKLLELVGHGADSWDAADPAWFRPTQQAAGTGDLTGPQKPLDASVQSTSSAVLPATKPIRAWNPAGLSD